MLLLQLVIMPGTPPLLEQLLARPLVIGLQFKLPGPPAIFRQRMERFEPLVRNTPPSRVSLQCPVLLLIGPCRHHHFIEIQRNSYVIERLGPLNEAPAAGVIEGCSCGLSEVRPSAPIDAREIDESIAVGVAPRP